MKHVSLLPPGRAVVVTGGTQGIGRAIAARFLDAGAHVLVCARRPPAEPVRAGDATAAFVAADVREPAQIDAVVAEARARFGRLDVLVNNAGGSPPAAAASASPRFSAAIIQLNLVAPLWFAQRANAIMQEQEGGGVIINVASTSGLRPSPGTAAYGAAKAGLINLTESLAVEWGPRVRVVAVAPGPIRTDAAAAHFDAAALADAVPLGRAGEPDDVADACVMLASPWCRFVSGACLVVHGGGDKPMAATPGSGSH